MGFNVSYDLNFRENEVKIFALWKMWWPLKGPLVIQLTRIIRKVVIYLLEVYLVTALVPSETACLANSPGKRSRTAVWISREVMVVLLL